jgi:hypothetical protein
MTGLFCHNPQSTILHRARLSAAWHTPPIPLQLLSIPSFQSDQKEKKKKGTPVRSNQQANFWI